MKFLFFNRVTCREKLFVNSVFDFYRIWKGWGYPWFRFGLKFCFGYGFFRAMFINKSINYIEKSFKWQVRIFLRQCECFIPINSFQIFLKIIELIFIDDLFSSVLSIWFFQDGVWLEINGNCVKRSEIEFAIFPEIIILIDTISLSRHEQVCLSRLRFERYFSHHRAQIRIRNRLN